jgi:hypothetical protein
VIGALFVSNLVLLMRLRRVDTQST